MTTTNGRIWRPLVAVLLSMMAAACGGSDDAASDEGGSDADAGATESESNDQDEAAEIVVEAEEQPASEEALDDTEQADELKVIPPPSGELRIAEFGAVTSFNPAAVNLHSSASSSRYTTPSQGKTLASRSFPDWRQPGLGLTPTRGNSRWCARRPIPRRNAV